MVNDATTPTEYEEMLATAKTAVSDHKYHRAADVYKELLPLLDNQTETMESRKMLTDVLTSYGSVCRLLGELDNAVSLWKRAEKTAVNEGQEFRIFICTGAIYIRMGKAQEALTYHQRALEIARAHDNRTWLAIANSNIISSYKHNGDIDNAILSAETAVAIYEQLGDVDGQVQTFVRLALIYDFLGQFDKNIITLRKAEQLARKHNIQRNLTVILNNLGECYRYLYAMEDALACHQEGLEIASTLHLQAVAIDLTRNLGVDLIALDNAEQGITYLWSAIMQSRQKEMVDVMQQSLFSLSLAEITDGDQEMARQHIAELSALADKIDCTTYRADALYALGLYHQKMSDFKMAYKLLNEVCLLTSETRRSVRLWQAHAALASLAEDDNLAAIHNRIAAETIRQIADPIEDERLRETFLNAEPIRAVLDKVHTP